MMNAKSFTDLTVHRKAHEMVLAMYRLTLRFPREELFGLTSRPRRAAVSVPANIAEGFVKRGKADKLRFYNIAQVRWPSATTISSSRATWATLQPTISWQPSMKSAAC